MCEGLSLAGWYRCDKELLFTHMLSITAVVYVHILEVRTRFRSRSGNHNYQVRTFIDATKRKLKRGFRLLDFAVGYSITPLVRLDGIKAGVLAFLLV